MCYYLDMLKKRQLEQIVRGFSNHRRIEILDLIERKPELSLSEITSELKINLKTASGHVRRLIVAGLIMKRSQRNNIRHRLSKRGAAVLNFLKILE